MDRAITLGGLLVTLGIAAGVALLLGGALVMFAGMMSDAPAKGEATSRHGCFTVIGGIALLVLCAWNLL